MRWTAILGAAVAAVMVAGQALPLQAQAQPGQPRQQAVQQQQAGPQGAQTLGALEKANYLIGLKVRNPEGRDLGRIHDIVVDGRSGRIAYAVLSFGGFLGLGEKYFAIPWPALQLNTAEKHFVLNVSKEQLDSAKGFDKSNWPEMGNETFLRETYRHYGYQYEQAPGQQPQGMIQGQQPQDRPAAERRGAVIPEEARELGREIRGEAREQGQEMRQQQMVRVQDRREFWTNRLSRLIGLNVANPEDQNLGNLEDLVIDVNNGLVAYGVLSYGGALGVGEKLVLVPWRALDLQPDRERFVLDTTRQRLDQVAFAADAWPKLDDEQYALRIHRTFNEQPYWQVFAYGLAPEQMDNQAWAKGSEFNQKFSANQMQSIEGTIQSVGVFSLDPNAELGLRLRVLTAEGNTVTVFGGPMSYFEQKGISYNVGDRVTIRGAKAQVNGSSGVIASQIIQKGGKTINLRDEQGQPLWSLQAGMPGQQGLMQGQQQRQPAQQNHQGH